MLACLESEGWGKTEEVFMSRMFRNAGLVAVLSLASGLGVLAGSASAQSTYTSVPFNQGSLYYSPSYASPSGEATYAPPQIYGSDYYRSQQAAGYYQPDNDTYAPGMNGYPYASFAPRNPSLRLLHRPYFPARRGLGLAKPWLWYD